ncbi:maestro heat-like repeat-containing protein family member 1 [Pyxicephalus adspersus]|uniref:maestro heat-like repeat-containing protein family member 1 n=1 Tax=Pyxicephalus adspersus TaxID=30357 RepID=UPI003B5A01F0
MAGSSVKRLAVTLMDSSTDKDPDVQEQIYSSLCFMGETAAVEVLESCDSYLRQHDKLSSPHRSIILRAMKTIVKDNLPTLNRDTAKTVILLASNEMTKSKDVVFEWQQAASDVLVAVGRSYINDVMEEILVKFQPGILPHFFVMQTLANLSVANVFGMVPFVNSILGTMLPMLGMAKQDPMKAVFCVGEAICSSLDSSTLMMERNKNELLRCFTVLGSKFPDYLLSFLLPKLETSNPKVRVGTLIILKQVINSSAPFMEVKKPLILAAVRPPLEDNSNRVRRAMVQLISAMAHHGYLEQHGGDVLLEYIIRLCCITPNTMVHQQVMSHPCPFFLCIIAQHPLQIFFIKWDIFLFPYFWTTQTEPIYWLVPIYSKPTQHCGNVISRVFNGHSMAVQSWGMDVVGMVVLSASVQPTDGRNEAALRLLSVLQINIHPAIGRCWEQEIPHLLQCLEGNRHGHVALLLGLFYSVALFQLLVGSLHTVSDDAWTCQLSQEMRKQLGSYNDFPVEKNFLYKCIGTTLGACCNRDVVRIGLQELLTNAQYQDETEREGLATAFGICSTHHLDDTLEKLSEFLKSDIMKKNVGIFNIFKDRADGDLEKIKSALILCYGYVALHAPTELVLPRIESDILRNVFLYFHTKDLSLKLCLIRSISMIGLAVCNSSQAGFFHFSRKSELISQLVEFLKLEPIDDLRSALRHRALLACTYLVKLEPPLNDASKTELINTALASVFPLPPIGSGIPGELHKETLYVDTLDSLIELLQSLILWNLTPQGLQDIFTILNPWIKSSKEHERERALDVSAGILKFYLQKLNVNSVVPFHNLGLLIGRLSPRCSDSLASIRQRTLDCIYYLLYIQLRYEGFAPDHKDELVEKLLTLRHGLMNPDSNILFHTCYNIAMIIGKRLPPEQLTSLLFITFESLSDPDTNCSRAATVMINSLLKDRGSILLSKVPEIINRVREQLEETSEEHIKKAAIQAIYILATQHVGAVVSSLLSSPLPYDSETCTLWKALSSDPPLTSQVLDLLLAKMTGDVPYKENKSSLLSSSSNRVATLLPLAATCALQEVLSQPESAPVVQELHPQLFVALLLRVSSMVGVQPPKNLGATKDRKSPGLGSASPPRTVDPCSCAIETLKFMLTQGGNEEVMRGVEADGGWENMKKEDAHHVGVASLSSAMVRCAAPKLPVIIKNLQAAQGSVYDGQRITATAFLAQLLASSELGGFVFLEPLMDNMTSRLKDSRVIVRMLAVRGLGNIASGYPEKVRKNGTHLLTAMINAMDDREDPEHIVTQEAMSSLCRLLPYIKDTDLHSLLIHTAIRIRPFFDHERTDLRAASIMLFGTLSKFVAGQGEEVLFEQILNGLVTLLHPAPILPGQCLHTLGVYMAPCPHTAGSLPSHPGGIQSVWMCTNLPPWLCHIGVYRAISILWGPPYLGVNVVSEQFFYLSSLLQVQGYPEVIARLIQTNVTYFKSIWPEIRAAAPMFIGFLVLHMRKDQCKMVDLDHLVTSLIVLLKDPIPSVRVKASETLGRLVKFV